ncbi:endonuclease/exonuclease/phosphatase family protein [Arenibacter sp. BSSL-BM3]|uniref:Endonuclease/exonuclease/phosphatase family protein n=1 Tax=Arenibacter arenosicollis TaxID=2762274 RepID=A0ABR7QTF3_9FLAO|nr:endonuclease/exonuclease/phosphatase family protein [Arenibacter arenosicollis]MBC8770482.1 endonuclease/exonuclease/phosphatase family protein [Arenibacter arenosicollis]
MKSNSLYYFGLIFFILGCKTQEPPTTFKVMAWNILHGGNDIANGSQNVVKIISEINPDVLLMVETYGSGKMIADSLGYNFHLIAPEGTATDDKGVNLSIFSKYPFGERIDTGFPFYLGGREILIKGQKVRVFSNWFHYLPWADEPENLGKTTAELLEWEKTETKYEMIQKVLPHLEKYASEANTIPMIFGGDLNTPSHLDWGEETKKNHNGLVVPWYSTKILEDIGLIDTYRTLNPNPISHPGTTWHTKGRNDNHRIDYIFYKGARLEAIKSESYKVFFAEPFSINGKMITYPSDHGFVVTTFRIYIPD